MANQYWVSHFAERRKDQLIQIPRDYAIHKDFIVIADRDEIRDAFSQIHALYSQISQGIMISPEEFGMPLYAKDEYRHFSQQCRDSEQAASRPFMLMALLFSSGDDCAGSIVVSIERFKARKPRPTSSRAFSEKVTNAPFLFRKLTEYGFVFEGLINYKASNQDIVIHYPDNPLLLRLWKMLADKAFYIDHLQGFINCSYRLLQDDMHTKGYSDLEGFIDTFPLKEEKDFVCKMDEMLVSKGLLHGEPGYYYRTEGLKKNKGPCSFRLVNINQYDPWHSEIAPKKLEVGLRIRNVQNCKEYLQSCPDSVKRIFTKESDTGCQRRRDNSCLHGVGYEFDGQEYWRCGCCDPTFRFQHPKAEDIPHYITLVELGEK